MATTRRVPRPTTLRVNLESGRDWRTGFGRLQRLARGGRPITLYRGQKIQNIRTGGLRRLKAVGPGQSWSTSPKLALEFATPYHEGGGGLLYSIKVPAAEFRHMLTKRARDLPDSVDYKPQKDSGGWDAMIDLGRLEIRPTRARSDLKPKIVGSVRERGGATEYGFTRRLRRARPSIGAGA